MSYHNFIVDLITRAGTRVKEAHTALLHVSHKEDDIRNPVTDVDIEISNFLISEIKKEYPEHQVYSEEDEEKQGLTLKGFEWVLDPIDGTGNFSHHIPHFSICAALLEDGVPIAGAIFNPITNELFSFDGAHAFLNGIAMQVSHDSEPEKSQGLLIVGHQQKLWPWGNATYASLLEHLNKLKGLGSANLDLAFLAAGRAEVVVYGTFSMPDGASGVGIVRAAGGEVYTLPSGNPITMERGRHTIVATSNRELFEKIKPLLHAELLPK